MGEARHLGAKVKLIDLFFKESDLEHLAIEVEPALVVGGRVLSSLRLGFLRSGHQFYLAQLGYWSVGVMEFWVFRNPSANTPSLLYAIFRSCHPSEGFK